MVKLISTLLSLLLVFTWSTPAMAASPGATITQEQLEQGNQLANKALAATNKGDFATAEIYWTQIIEQFPTNAGAWSNRGNSRVSQNKLAAALTDYNKAIECDSFSRNE
jgi:tetratricopeptide (TPR) repeat protein